MASEINEKCRQVYFDNHKIMPVGDIHKIDEKDVPDHHILCAGFPCQPFSKSGKMKGFDDVRGTLFFEICRIAKEKKTPVLLLENVAHLLKHDQGNTFLTIKKTLEGMGYTLSYDLLNAVNFHIPQNRERLIIVATLNDISFNFDMISSSYNSQSRKKTSIRDILDIDNENTEYLDKSEYTIISSPIKQKSGLIFCGYKHGNTRKNGAKNQDLNLSRVHKQPNRIYHIDGTHPTISSQETSGRFFIYIPEIDKVRKLSITECYRLFGFNDNFQISNVKADSYRQIGNSVCVPMVKIVVDQIRLQLFS